VMAASATVAASYEVVLPGLFLSHGRSARQIEPGWASLLGIKNVRISVPVLAGEAKNPKVWFKLGIGVLVPLSVQPAAHQPWSGSSISVSAKTAWLNDKSTKQVHQKQFFHRLSPGIAAADIRPLLSQVRTILLPDASTTPARLSVRMALMAEPNTPSFVTASIRLSLGLLNSLRPQRPRARSSALTAPASVLSILAARIHASQRWRQWHRSL